MEEVELKTRSTVSIPRGPRDSWSRRHGPKDRGFLVYIKLGRQEYRGTTYDQKTYQSSRKRKVWLSVTVSIRLSFGWREGWSNEGSRFLSFFVTRTRRKGTGESYRIIYSYRCKWSSPKILRRLRRFVIHKITHTTVDSKLPTIRDTIHEMNTKNQTKGVSGILHPE